jgi:hypothetical protein
MGRGVGGGGEGEGRGSECRYEFMGIIMDNNDTFDPIG